MVNVPEFDLNDPFTSLRRWTEGTNRTPEEKQDALNQMWRNRHVSMIHMSRVLHLRSLRHPPVWKKEW